VNILFVHSLGFAISAKGSKTRKRSRVRAIMEFGYGIFVKEVLIGFGSRFGSFQLGRRQLEGGTISRSRF